MQGLLKFVGAEFWPWPHDHVKETRERGPSVRIAPDSVPDLDTPYPIVFVHPRGTFSVTTPDFTLADLWVECVNEGHLDDDLEDCVVDGLPTLLFIRALSLLPKEEKDRLNGKYGIKFAPAATHYSYVTGVQVVMGDGGEGEDVLSTLQARGVDVEPVKVVRVEEVDNADD